MVSLLILVHFVSLQGVLHLKEILEFVSITKPKYLEKGFSSPGSLNF